MYSLDSVTPTVCELMGVPYPNGASAAPIAEVLSAMETLGVRKVRKALLYAPDAIGEWHYQSYVNEFAPVVEAAPVAVRIRSMTPSKTPVCYGSMFTGMKPHEHGITQPERRVLTVDTLFDTLERSGLSVAIVATSGSSIDILFKERRIDYYSEPYDGEVNTRVHEILGSQCYDVIVAYNQEYDDGIHSSTPTSVKSMKGFRNHLKAFVELSEAFNARYRGLDRCVAFLPDHGVHLDPESGRGTHGSDMPDDMDVRHFWGVYRGE